MLIDRRQTRWAVVTILVGIAAVGFYLWADNRSANPLTGGTPIGLWYGILGSALMVYAGLLSAHRLFPAAWWMGPRKVWLRGHLWLGSLSVVLIVCHAHARLGTGVALALWVVLAGIVLTGFYGLVLQQVLPGWLARRFPDESAVWTNPVSMPDLPGEGRRPGGRGCPGRRGGDRSVRRDDSG